MANDRITRTPTPDGFILDTTDLTDPRRPNVMATIAYAHDRQSYIVVEDGDGIGEPLLVPTDAAETIARRMLAIYG